MNKDFLFARIEDCIDLCLKTGREKATDFLDPAQRARVEVFLKHRAEGLSWCFEGGYPESERRVAIFSAQDTFNPEEHLSVLGVTTPGRLSHRDYLGAVLGTGIEKDKVGDVVVAESGAQIIVKAEVASFLLQNLERVGRLRVDTEVQPLGAINPPEKKVKEIRGTVPSLRLDAVIARAFGLSRSQAVPLIKGEKVQVNWTTVTVPSRELNAGDILSLRGKGRALLAEVSGTSRKGRIVIRIDRYL